MRQTDYRGAAVREPTIKRFVGPIIVYRLIKSGSRREHAARIDNGCLIARKARHRDEPLGDKNRPHDRETTAQTGSATWREREGREVWIAGGAVAFKKKTK